MKQSRDRFVEPARRFRHTRFIMKAPIPTSVLSGTRYTVAAYDVSAFLSVPHDVGGRALSTPTQSVPRRPSILPVIIVAILACAIAILAVAAASADTIPNTNGAVVVRYSGKIAFGAAPVRQNDNVAVESVIERRMESLFPRAIGFRNCGPVGVLDRAELECAAVFRAR